jgi:5-(aminomethyl)-3-furanmethanol phosphate kinase
VLTVVKIGGGVGEDALAPLCAALAELHARHRLVVVPGGAWFADAVRHADRRFGLSDAAAHRMAILAMEQFGLLLRDLLGEQPQVVMPASLPLEALPASWQVTSDSIAAWVAGEVGANRLVLVKEVDGLFAEWPAHGEPLPELSVAELAALRPGGVDEYLPTLLAQASFETWVIGGRNPDRLVELLERGTTVGTRIALLP